MPRKSEVDALGVIIISRGCFERCCSNKKTAVGSTSLGCAVMKSVSKPLARELIINN